MQKFLERFYLDKHHTIERFGVIFCILSVSLFLVTLSIMGKHQKDNSTQITEQAMYTQVFKTSLTGVQGAVENIYTNSTKTKAFILLKFDDMKSISTDANEYQMFLTGSNLAMTPTELTVNPSGSIYMFGSTGYMGVYLAEARGFDKQILDLVVRCNKQIANTSETADADPVDASFSKYDQFRIYLNAGGNDALVADILDTKEELKISDMYEAFITSPQEQVVRSGLTSMIDTMKLDLDRIAEYEQRLLTAKIQIPDAPKIIQGDYYEVTDGGTPDDTSDDVTYIVTNTIVPTGFDFNWYNGSVRSGYLKELAGDKTFSNYLSAKLEDSEETPCGDPKTCYIPFSMSDITWRRSDGSLFNADVNSAIATNSDIAIANDIAGLQEAWRTYYGNKTNYQISGLRGLLMLEADVADSNSNFTINNEDWVLTNW